MSFIPKAPKEANNYAQAIREGMSALRDGAPYWYVTPDALGRRTPFVATNVAKGIDKFIAAGKLPVTVATGIESDTGETVVALQAMGAMFGVDESQPVPAPKAK